MVGIACAGFVMSASASDVGARAGFVEQVAGPAGQSVSEASGAGLGSHASVSGVAHFATPDEHAALALLRELLSYVPQNNLEEAPRKPKGKA